MTKQAQQSLVYRNEHSIRSY